MKTLYPEKLKNRDEVRVIAPSRTMAIISKETREIAGNRFAELGLKLSFGKHVDEKDGFFSSSIEARIEDLHDAFLDKNVKAVITAIGGFNSNQLLKYINWKFIKDNPKIFCGYSDITILNNAILQKVGLVNYYGPHYSTFGQKMYFDYTLDYFKKCLMQNNNFEVLQSDEWTDDQWYLDQNARNPIKNGGWKTINEGLAQGTIIGGNLCTLNLLQGTEYFPELKKNTILFLEDDEMPKNLSAVEFDRNLQSLICQPGFENVLGLVIGRFQIVSDMPNEKIERIIKGKKELSNLPVICGVDFGHTSPIITFPVGGEAIIEAKNGKAKIEIIKH